METTIARTPMSSVAKTLLGQRLRQRRKSLNLRLEDVANRLGWNIMRYQKIEVANWQRFREDDFQSILRALEIEDPEEVAAFMNALEAARKSGWWKDYADVFVGAYVSMEAEASYVSGYQSVLVHGLLQSPAYLRAIHVPSPVLSVESAERSIEARLARQRDIFSRRTPPGMSFVFDEHVFRMAADLGVGRVQAEHLVNLMEEHPSLQVQVLLRDARMEGHVDIRPFTLLEFQPPASELLYSEGGINPDYITDQETISTYRRYLASAASRALSNQKTLEYIKAQAKK